MFKLASSITRRLLAYISSSIVAALLISAATQYLAMQPILEQTRSRSVDAAIENISGLITQSLWVYNDDAFQEASAALLRDQFISGVIVNDHVGDFEFRGGDLAEATHKIPRLSEIQRIIDDEALVINVPLIVSVEDSSEAMDYNIGSLQVRSSNALILEQVYELTRVTMAVSSFIIIALLILFYFLVHRLLARPLEMVTRHVQQYATNLDPNITAETPELKERTDEIGRLYTVFNNQRIHLIEQDRSLREHRDQLERLVAERTAELSHTNETLVKSMDQLKRAQNELIQNEKLVSLGTLVSGIAHEVNTPLGISITAASHLAEEIRVTRKALSENKLTKSNFETFMEECHETETLLTNNLNRAAALIQSFKKVAVDQSSDERRDINLRGYIDEIILSLRPKIKRTQIHVHNNVPENVDISLAPGAVAQIITNLIMNSIIHGFNNGSEPGNITISAKLNKDSLRLEYSDDGVGMEPNTLKQIYDPFFTTRRSEGGSGLGMNIVYNLVASKLNGTIETRSQPGEGLTIIMNIKI